MRGVFPSPKDKANNIVQKHLILWPVEKVKEKAVDECRHWQKQSTNAYFDYWGQVIREIEKMNL